MEQEMDFISGTDSSREKFKRNWRKMHQATIVYGMQCCKKAILSQIEDMDEDSMSMNLHVVII